MEYSAALLKHTLHWFKFLMLGKQHCIDVRENNLQPGNIAIQHDFTETLNIIHNGEMQSAHFESSLNLSLESYTVKYQDGCENDTVLDFYLFLSDDTTQIAATVYNHMYKSLKQLRKNKEISSTSKDFG